MKLGELATHCRPVASGERLPILRLERDEDIVGMVGWFGADRSRQAARLIVHGEDAGALDRTAVYELVGTHSMGFGGGGSTLPGASAAWSVVELACPEPGCPDSPLYAVSYDAARPPHCALHPAQVLAPR